MTEQAQSQPVSATDLAVSTSAVRRPRAWRKWVSSTVFYVSIGFFVVNLVLLVATVVIDSFGQSWFKTVLPPAFTTDWYGALSQDHDMTLLLINTFVVASVTTAIALIIGFPAAYVLARKQFRFKGLLTAALLLPMLIPSLVYGFPLATLLLSIDLGGKLAGVIVINLVPIVPFVILILTPFIEQVDMSLESASRMLGASRLRTFWRIVLPLTIPGMLTAGVLAIVRAIAAFELTYLVATTGNSQTLVTALYGDFTGAGIRAHQETSAMAVVYMLFTMTFVVVALFFVKPTQFVVRIKAK
ncbi:MAG: ABC transporter permease [Aggregatilineales bacterium]